MIFGYKETIYSKTVEWLKPNGTMIMAWVFVVVAALAAISAIVLGILGKNIKVGPLSLDVLLYCFAGLLLLVAGIIYFCALPVTGLSGDGEHLGVGFILGGIFALIGTVASICPFFLKK
jgi:hypothetical protein